MTQRPSHFSHSFPIADDLDHANGSYLFLAVFCKRSDLDDDEPFSENFKCILFWHDLFVIF